MSPPAPRNAASDRGGDVEVRVATERDAAGIARIYNHHVDAGGATFDTGHWQVKDVASLILCARPDGWFVAVETEKVIGWSSVRQYSLRHGYRFTCETAVYLDPWAVGRGVADLLQEWLEEHCRRCNIHHAVAKIIADNQPSMRFHYRHGYELVGIQNEIGHMDGEWTDVAILQKIFR